MVSKPEYHQFREASFDSLVKESSSSGALGIWEMPSGLSCSRSSGHVGHRGDFCSAPELAGGTIQGIPSGMAVPLGPQGEMLPGRVLLCAKRCLE